MTLLMLGCILRISFCRSLEKVDRGVRLETVGVNCIKGSLTTCFAKDRVI
jgi:hypothetical protein